MLTKPRCLFLVCALGALSLAACASGESGDIGAVADAAATPDAGARSDASVPQPDGDRGPGGDFRAYADAAAEALQSYYDPGTGLWTTTGWWQSANALTAIIEYSRRTGSTAYLDVIATTFDAHQAGGFLNDYYDDEGWWALAWIDAYELTGEARYLEMAESIFADMTGGWDDVCGGGIWWRKAKDYKNAIANSLFLQVAARLHEHAPGGGYLEWAEREWAWFEASGMINGDDLVNDGLADCKNNGQTTWSYNQGALIGGLAELSRATGDAALLARANAIAAATMGALADERGVLREPCEPSCGADGPLFKGVFMRNLGRLLDATEDPAQQAFITTSADWLWNAGRDAQDRFGLSWTGPVDQTDAARQTAALDALTAAIPFSDPQPNLARTAAARASSICADDETAAEAIDGNLATKWCAGSAGGTYWLEVDLGSRKTVGRVIVRHAGAGGEDPQWNTRDFTLTGGPEPLARVKDNALPVTIHRFEPTALRTLRLEITEAQSTPELVAARVYEVEIHPR